MVVIAVVVRRLLHQALRARQPLQFGRYRFLEGQGLDAPAGFMMVVREGPIDRIAKNCDELHVGIERPDSLRGQRVNHVVGRGFEGDHPASPGHALVDAGEVGKIPGAAFPVLEVEVVNLFAKRRQYARMCRQKSVERGRSASHCSDDEKRRCDACKRRCPHPGRRIDPDPCRPGESFRPLHAIRRVFLLSRHATVERRGVSAPATGRVRGSSAARSWIRPFIAPSSV